MSYVLDYQGKPYRKIFEDISRIPRWSFHEEKIAAYVVQWAKDRGLRFHEDEHHNVIIYKDATPGYESHTPIMLQGHMDMIWAKRPGSTFDFETQPIELVEKDGYLMARETTCGSDDGVAVAYMLAILDEKDLQHPALECVFTTAEEAGCVGAMYVDAGLLHAKKMISMDGNTEGTTLVMTAGAINGSFEKAVHRQAEQLCTVVELQVSGLQGGHSANAMNKEGANAIKILARMLHYIQKEQDIGVVRFHGGAVSTIPAEATAVVAVQPELAARALEIANRIAGEVAEEHRDSDPRMKFSSSSYSCRCAPMDPAESKDLITLLYMLPTGCVFRSLVFENLPFTTANLEVISLEENSVSIRYKPKSVVKSQMLDMAEHLHMYASLYGFEYRESGCYPGHYLPFGTPLCQTYAEVYKEETGLDLKPVGVHYGNEIGLFREKIPDLDVIVLVATHFAAHTPDEKLDIASFDRNYTILKKVLERS